MSDSKIPVLLIGLDADSVKIIEDLLKTVTVQNMPMEMDALLQPAETTPAMIITGVPKGDFNTNELAQALRMHYQEQPVYICTTERQGFERKTFVKNGFTDAFLLPMDTTIFRTSVSDTIANLSKGAIKTYRSVKIIDVEPGTVLDFDTSVFLPANNKYVKTSNAGDALDPDRIERMKKSKFNNVYVPAEQMKSFYQYSARRLKDLGKTAISSTEKREKLSGAVRDLISGMFTDQAASFESGQAVMKDCGEIVKTYIMEGADNEWYSRIQNVLGEATDSYSHSANVSTLAALFSMGLGVGKPEDMALAGLLHDIGTAELPPEIQAADPEDMTKEQMEIYKKHPDLSVQLIKSRKIVVPEIVMKAIAQHHELYNGTGYPHGLFGDRICKEAQVLGLANMFDYLTRLRPGKAQLTPIQAVEKIRQEQVNDPSKIHYNPELLKKLLTLFPGPGTP